MNQYGIMRLRHLEKTLPPEQLAEIDDLHKLCEQDGEQAEQMMARLIEELPGPDIPGEGYLARMQRHVTATHQARERVMREIILTPTTSPEDFQQ